MANVSYMKGLNFEDGNSVLLAVFGNDVAKLSGSNWIGQSQNLIPGDYMISKGKSYGYLTGINVASRVINSSGTWSQETNMDRAPRAKFNYPFKDRVFFGYNLINGVYYRRRVHYTDIIEKDDSVAWDIEYGSDLVQTAGSDTITSAGSKFIERKIKIGDPFIITSGNNQGVHVVSEITNNSTIVLTQNLVHTASSNSFIVGGNWFDLNGEVTGLGEHYGVLLAFESDRAWRWSPSVGKKEVMGCKGTFLYKSIVNNNNGYSFWYHPSEGIVQFNGSVASVISGKIQPILDGMTDKSVVVGWSGVGENKSHLYYYIGNTTFKVNGETFTLNKVIIDYNVQRSKWKIYEYNAVITSATTFIENGQEVVYLGTSSSLVLKFNDGTHDYDVAANDGTTLPIHAYMVTHPVYPSGIEVENMFDKYYSIKDSGNGIKSAYKLHGNVDKNDSTWSDLQELNDNYNETKIDPQKSKARGISFMISEISKNPSFEFLGFSVIYSVVGESYDDKE